MFKPGQVIRSKISGLYAVVAEATAGSSLCSIRMLTGDAKGVVLQFYPRTDPQSELIGNNYQERPTKPVQPGAAFKRWLSEMTGDLPEQRGCRKEDC